MRMLFRIKFPHETFNSVVRSGKISETMKGLVREMKPEAAYFSEIDGHRGAVIVTDVPSDADIPRLCEPWFLKLNADIEIRVAMTPADLENSDLDTLGKRWT